jgi:hypothetical protein
MNEEDFNKLIKPLADEWFDVLFKAGLVNKDETNTMLEQKNMTNRPNLTEEEKEHYNKVAMDLINNKTPRTDAFFNRTNITWDDEVVFAQDLEIELNETRNLLNEAITLADTMSDEINQNWCKESKLAVAKLNLIIEKAGYKRA